MPKVSVIMPAFNSENYLAAAVQSVLDQTFRDFELLVLDDASRDSTKIIAESFARVDNRVRLLENNENLGISASLNKLIKHANGEYIARMDSDDIAISSRLEKQVACLDKGVDLCGTWTSAISAIRSKKIQYPERDEDIRAALLFGSAFAHPTVMVKARLVKDEPYSTLPRVRHAEDYDLWVRLSRTANMANLPEALVRYRQHRAQVSQENREAQWAATAYISEIYGQELGVFASSEDIKIHKFLHFPGRIRTRSQLIAVEDWLYRLADWFGFETNARDIVCSQWLKCCVQSGHLGLFTARRLLASRLRSEDKGSFKLVAAAIALSSLHAGYGSLLYRLAALIGPAL